MGWEWHVSISYSGWAAARGQALVAICSWSMPQKVAKVLPKTFFCLCCHLWLLKDTCLSFQVLIFFLSVPVISREEWMRNVNCSLVRQCRQVDCINTSLRMNDWCCHCQVECIKLSPHESWMILWEYNWLEGCWCKTSNFILRRKISFLKCLNIPKIFRGLCIKKRVLIIGSDNFCLSV